MLLPAITPKEIILIDLSKFLQEAYILLQKIDIFLDYFFSNRVLSFFASLSSLSHHFMR